MPTNFVNPIFDTKVKPIKTNYLMLKELINTIEKKVVLNEEDLLLCAKYFEPLNPTKNALLETQGKVPEYLYFIATGVLC